MQPAMAEQLGPYLLETRIGSGGMADVFLARGPSGVCVVKRPHPHLCANPEFVRMFLDEASLLAQLHHPGIAHIFDLGQSAGVYYLAMEYVPGFDLMTISLEHERQGEFMAADLAAKVIADAAGALDYAHRAVGKSGKPLHIIHRDVTPHNILVSTSGEVKVIDFGVARAAKSMHQTAAGLVKGKYPYMSPEQITGQAIDHRVDIYALGLVLYELLTNARAIAGELEFEQIDNARSARIKPVEQLRPNVPEQLRQILGQALHPQPSGRYQTAAQMQSDLLNFLKTGRHVVGREDLVRLFRVVAAEASHQLPTLPPNTPADPSIRETIRPGDVEPVSDETLRPSAPPRGIVHPSPPMPGRSDTYPSGPKAVPSDSRGTDKSPAHQPRHDALDPSKRPTDAYGRVSLDFLQPPPKPIQLNQPVEHPTIPAMPPPTKLIPGGSAGVLPSSPLDSSLRRTIVSERRSRLPLILAIGVLVGGAGFLGWFFLLKPKPAPVLPPPVKQVEPLGAVVDAGVEPPDAGALAAAPETPDASALPAIAQETGEILVTTDLPVHVMVGTQDYGATGKEPVRLKAPVGEVTLDLVLPDKRTVHEKVTVKKGETAVVRRNFRLYKLELVSNPFAEFFVDGRKITQGTSICHAEVTEGPHFVVVVNPKSPKPLKQTITVVPGAENTFTLEPELKE